jgi:uncharacterized protein YndB with AHSA1/START domain
MEKPYRVEVTVDAPRDEVWRALTELEQIRHWFGWEYDGLDDEIRFIFIDNATPEPPDRIVLGPDDQIELEDHGGRTLIRITRSGDLDAAEWQDVVGEIEEGWITFLNQLRHRIARHPHAQRRTIFLSGTVIPRALSSLEGELWHETPYQRGVDIDGTLVVPMAKAPLTSNEPAEAMIVVTTYDLDDRDFAAAEAHWTSWFKALESS